jgi:hypothetical protein
LNFLYVHLNRLIKENEQFIQQVVRLRDKGRRS